MGFRVKRLRIWVSGSKGYGYGFQGQKGYGCGFQGQKATDMDFRVKRRRK